MSISKANPRTGQLRYHGPNCKALVIVLVAGFAFATARGHASSKSSEDNGQENTSQGAAESRSAPVRSVVSAVQHGSDVREVNDAPRERAGISMSQPVRREPGVSNEGAGGQGQAPHNREEQRMSGDSESSGSPIVHKGDFSRRGSRMDEGFAEEPASGSGSSTPAKATLAAPGAGVQPGNDTTFTDTYHYTPPNYQFTDPYQYTPPATVTSGVSSYPAPAAFAAPAAQPVSAFSATYEAPAYQFTTPAATPASGGLSTYSYITRTGNTAFVQASSANNALSEIAGSADPHSGVMLVGGAGTPVTIAPGGVQPLVSQTQPSSFGSTYSIPSASTYSIPSGSTYSIPSGSTYNSGPAPTYSAGAGKPANPSPASPTNAGGGVGPSYTVRSGDTLGKIAGQNGMSLPQLLALNPQFQGNPNVIQVGQQVNLPTFPQAHTGAPTTAGIAYISPSAISYGSAAVSSYVFTPGSTYASVPNASTAQKALNQSGSQVGISFPTSSYNPTFPGSSAALNQPMSSTPGYSEPQTGVVAGPQNTTIAVSNNLSTNMADGAVYLGGVVTSIATTDTAEKALGLTGSKALETAGDVSLLQGIVTGDIEELGNRGYTPNEVANSWMNIGDNLKFAGANPQQALNSLGEGIYSADAVAVNSTVGLLTLGTVETSVSGQQFQNGEQAALNAYGDALENTGNFFGSGIYDTEEAFQSVKLWP
jgi:LysM repeat protein